MRRLDPKDSAGLPLHFYGYAIAVPEMLYVSNQIWSDSVNVPEMMNVLLICYVSLVGILVWLMHKWENAMRIPGQGVAT